MRKPKSLEDRAKDRQLARDRQLASLRRVMEKRSVTPIPADLLPVHLPEKEPSAIPVSPRIQSLPQLFASRQNDVPLRYQPWASSLVDLLCARSEDSRLSIRLLWPAQIDGLATIHAAASLSKVLRGDLRGLRSLYFPGSNATRLALDKLLIDRSQLQHLRRSLWDAEAPGHAGTSARSSEAVDAILTACNDVSLFNPTEQSPQLREVIPTFLFQPGASSWSSTKVQPLERLIRKVAKPARRADLRKKIDAEWTDPLRAPGALFVMSRDTKKRDWKAAFAKSTSPMLATPTALLIDATSKVSDSDPNSVRRIPEFVSTAYGLMGKAVGTLIVTDDPTLYFLLRSGLTKRKLAPDCGVYPAEGDFSESFYVAHPKSESWKPDGRSPVNFSVSILDQDAAALAAKFGRIADCMRSTSSESVESLRKAQLFVMRASHLPGGFFDLQSEDPEERDYLRRDLDWSRVESPIVNALDRGVLNVQRSQVESALSKARALVEQCADATPLALKLLDQVKRFTTRGLLSVVLRNPRDIVVAQRFLARKLSSSWGGIQDKIEWLTLKQAVQTLHTRTDDRRLTVVGLTRNVIRLLLTHSEIPAGTQLLVPAQRALGVVPTLEGMERVSELKPYRARISGLLHVLKERLAELPNLEGLSHVLDSSLLSVARTSTRAEPVVDPRSYQLHLEDGRVVSASGFVYRYDTVEGMGFQRVSLRQVEVGDLIFEMSESLRDSVDEAMGLSDGKELIAASPQRKLLSIYHREVEERISSRFGTSRQGVVRALKAEITQRHPSAHELTETKLRYWTNVNSAQTIPHGARDREEFQFFCEALGMSRETAELYWQGVRAARTQNQSYGRYLSARYAEIIFQPESAQTYRALSSDVVGRLQAEAMDCIYRVDRIEEPKHD